MVAMVVIIVFVILSGLFFAWCLCRAAKIGDSQFGEDTDSRKKKTPAPKLSLVPMPTSNDKDPPAAA